MHAIPAPGGQRQEDGELEASWDTIRRPCFKIISNNNENNQIKPPIALHWQDWSRRGNGEISLGHKANLLYFFLLYLSLTTTHSPSPLILTTRAVPLILKRAPGMGWAPHLLCFRSRAVSSTAPQASTLPTLGCGTYADLHGPPKNPGHSWWPDLPLEYQRAR